MSTKGREISSAGRFFFAFVVLALFGSAPSGWGKPALVGEVTIEWEAIEGSSQYDLEVRHGNELVERQRLPATPTRWKGRLPYGSYAYRLRAVDSGARSGPWAEPVRFFVAPPAPKTLSPANESTVFNLSEKRIVLSWSEVPGIKRYTISLFQSGKTSRKFPAKGTSLELPFLFPGSYSWQVAPVIEDPDPDLQIPPSLLAGFRVELVEGMQNFSGDWQQLALLVPARGSPFKERQYVCLYLPSYPSAAPVACGMISEKSADQIRINLTSQRIGLQEGDKFELRLPEGPRRAPSSESSESSEDSLYVVTFERGGFRFDVTGGLAAGTQYFLPTLELQTSLWPRLSLGLLYEYAYGVDSSGSLRANGIFLVVTRYFGDRDYSGFFGKTGVGTYLLSDSAFGKTEGPLASPALFLCGGWQWRPSQQGFNLGLGAGAEWIGKSKLTQVQVPLAGLIPLVLFQGGYAF